MSPHNPAKTQIPSPTSLSPPADSRRTTVMVIEDDPSVLGILHLLLERKGYTVLVAQSGAEAIEVSGAHTGRIDIVVCDLILPDACGVDVARELSRRFPQMQVQYVTGHDEATIERHQCDLTGLPVMIKPLSFRTLHARIQALLALRDELVCAATP